ncbi:MAG TPA: hypothetical protein VIL78_03805 [Hanamia sp.]
MKKIIKRWLYLNKKTILYCIALIVLLCILILWVYNLLAENNINCLSSLNSIFQICFNIIYLIIAGFVAFIAYNQLKKTREATNIQSLHTTLNRYNGSEMQEKRMRLANYILMEEGSFKDKMKHHRINISKFTALENDELTEHDKIAIAELKNKIEAVISEFEIIGHFKKRGIYGLNDIHEFFSYELQRYWLLVNELGYISYRRKDEKDFYTQFEKLFENSIGFEIIGYECQIN